MVRHPEETNGPQARDLRLPTAVVTDTQLLAPSSRKPGGSGGTCHRSPGVRHRRREIGALMGRAAAGIIRAVVLIGRADGLGLSRRQASCRAAARRRRAGVLPSKVSWRVRAKATTSGSSNSQPRMARARSQVCTATSSTRISSSWAPVRSPARWRAVRAMAPGSPNAASSSAAVAANDAERGSRRDDRRRGWLQPGPWWRRAAASCNDGWRPRH